VGYAHICAQFAAGAFCWGSGAAFGTTGNVSVASRVEVKAVAAGGAVASLVEAGGGHTCWVQNGAVHCAGANGDGQASTSVVRAEGGSLQNVRDLAASTTHTCALTVDGELFCWGSNAYGQLGQPTASVLGSPLAMRVTLPP
jgi:alpha-tubulin suppressor-like RCC1 family protein